MFFWDNKLHTKFIENLDREDDNIIKSHKV